MFSSFGSPNPFPNNNNQNLNTSFNQNCSPFGITSPFFGSQRPTTSLNVGNSAFGQTPTKENSPFAPAPFANTPIFGQIKPATPIPPEPSFGVFKSFGATEPLGTSLKFKTTKDNESIFKSGISHHMGINYQSITCMKEYDNKSFEELRFEDYQLNRKGIKSGFPQNNNTPLLNPTPATTNFFGNQDNKLNFNQPSSNATPMTQIFGPTPTFGMNTTQQTPNTFGSSVLCDVNMSPSSSAFPKPNLFTPNPTPTPQFNFTMPSTSFGQPTTNFGQTQNTTPFAQNNLLSQNKPVNFNLNTPQTTNNFLPQTNTTPTLNQSLFNTPKMFNMPTTTTLEKPKTSPVNTSFPLTCSANLFGNATKPNPIFNFNQLSKLTAPCVPNTTNFQSVNTFPNQNQHQQIISMASTPYGANELLNNITPVGFKVKQYERITSPQEMKLLLKTVQTKTVPTQQKPPQQISFYGNKCKVFDGLEFRDESLVSNLRINDNPKRLILPNSAKYYSDSIFQHDCCTEIDYNNSNSKSQENLNDIQLTPEVSEIETCLSKPVSQTETKSISIQTEDINIEDNEEKSCDSEFLRHPTGIILTRPEYYIVPSLEELEQYMNEDGSCYVKGFTIGRYGYGSVYYPDTFNVANLNIDEIVHFRHKEITVYPNDNKKPPKDDELNRRAQITLDKVWPKDKKTKQLITDLKVLQEINYVGKLKQLCERQNTTFVDYRPDTGSWVFRVPEF